MAIFFRTLNDRSLIRSAIWMIGSNTKSQVEQKGDECDRCQPATVKHHHDESSDGHDPIEYGAHQIGGQCRLDASERAEPRNHVADMALLKIRKRKAQQVVKQRRRPLQVQVCSHDQHGPRTGQPKNQLQDNQNPKANCNKRQKIAI